MLKRITFLAVLLFAVHCHAQGVGYATAECGLNDAFTSTKCGNVGGSFSTVGLTPVSACDPSLGAGSYYLTQNVGSDATAICFPYYRTMNLNGYTVTGRFAGGSGTSISGVSIYNGTINCSWEESGSNTGCVRWDTSCPASLASLHHLTVTNSESTGSGRAIFGSFDSSCGSTKVKWYNLTATAPTCTGCSRTSAIWIQYGDHHELYNNDSRCLAASNACQGVGMYAAPGSRAHNNRISAETVNGTENSRLQIADGDVGTGCDGCEFDNNFLIVNNNRGFRVRNSSGVLDHNNQYKQIILANGFDGHGMHIGDPDTGTTDLGYGGSYNNTYEVGANTYVGWGRNFTNYTVRNNATTCYLASCANTYFWLARTPLGGGTTSVTLNNNSTAALPGVSLPPTVMIQAQSSATITNTGSGTCGGPGTCVP